MPARIHRNGWLAGLLLAGAAVSFGCSGAARERLLVALFDDPPRPGEEKAVEEQAAKPSKEDLAAELARQNRQPRSRVEGSIHGPYAARMCQACHAAVDENPDPEGGAARLRLAPQRLCLRCHETRYLVDLGGSLEAVHGPVAGGRCLACHLPHRSREKRMLRYAPADLCLRCHQRSDLGPDHPDIDEMECMTCHDAHAPARAWLEVARAER